MGVVPQMPGVVPPGSNNGTTANQPVADSSSVANRLWNMIDQRIGAAVRAWSRVTLGIPQPRLMTVVFPLADSNGPLPTDQTNSSLQGWLQSVPVFTHCRVVAWEISALGPGSVTLDVFTSKVQMDSGSGEVDPSIPPTLTSLVTGNGFQITPGQQQGVLVIHLSNQPAQNVQFPYPSLNNGYTTGANHTDDWAATEITAGAIIHVFVTEADTLTDAVFALLLEDLHGRVLHLTAQ